MTRHPDAGRKFGSKNKRTVLNVKSVLAERNLNAAEAILELIPLLDYSDQLRAWGLLLSYCEPKPTEIVQDVKSTSEEIIEQLKDVSDEKLIEAIDYKGKANGGA